MADIQGIIVFISLAALTLNLPFGYLRYFTRRFSLMWFLCIHIPIIFIAVIRISTETPWAYAPFFLGIGIFGQFLGHRLALLKNTDRKEGAE